MTEPADLRVVAPGEQAPAFATREDWLAAGRRLVDGRSDASWAFADWLAAGHGTWGKEAVEAAAEATGTSRGKIINYVTASKTYPLTRRRVRLTFSHHMEAAFLPDAEREGLLDRAEAEGWSHRETRAAARETSLEGKLARQRREIAELKRALKAAKADPKDAAAQARSRLDAEGRVILDALARAADIVTEVAGSGVLDGLHGNARAGLAAHIDGLGEKLAEKANDHFGRMGEAARKIRSQK